jgi:hypothetical protein
MTSTVLAISAAYVVICVLLLTFGLSSRFAWWVKASVIVVTSLFFVEVFFATKGLLGWPRAGQLPARFQLLWVRVVEPDVFTAYVAALESIGPADPARGFWEITTATSPV